MARKGALMPRTSSSLIPAKPERHPSYHLSSSRSENINFQTLSSIPESISLWPAISFIHFFLLNWKRRVLKKINFKSQTCSPKLCEIECEAISWPSGELLHDFLSDTDLRVSQSRCLNIRPSPSSRSRVSQGGERQGGSSWYSWGCPATWVEALHQAVVRPLMADVEGRCDRAAVRILAAWVEDLLVWTKVQVDNWTSGQKIS